MYICVLKRLFTFSCIFIVLLLLFANVMPVIVIIYTLHPCMFVGNSLRQYTHVLIAFVNCCQFQVSIHIYLNSSVNYTLILNLVYILFLLPLTNLFPILFLTINSINFMQWCTLLSYHDIQSSEKDYFFPISN